MSPLSSERATPAVRGWFDCELARDHAGQLRITRHPNGHTSIDGPALSIESTSDCDVDVADQAVTVVIGQPRDPQMRPLASADAGRLVDDATLLRGRFAILRIDLRAARAAIVTDRFAAVPLCYATQGTRIWFSDRADGVLRQPKVDLQAIFNYVYFHVIPAPRTIFQQVLRLLPATRLSFDAKGLHARSIWEPEFTAPIEFDLKGQGERLRALLRQAVERETTAQSLGAFLSGGTDSSTVVGMLTAIRGKPVDCFSIGFDASGYDEMSYARISAQHFNATLHEHYLTPDELLRTIPHAASYFDQPFGNSSVLPAYYCARIARENGIEKLLAGDGGDELFGGNVRYARQKVFAAYDVFPATLRRHLIEPLLLRSKVGHIPGVRKLARYVEQARTPMPERMESYNLLDRFGAGTIFTSAFLNAIDRDEPRALQGSVYGQCSADAIVDRMLAYDWRFTLADSDLPKVRMSAQLAGQTVGFPLLDDALVDFSLCMPASMKVRGFALRYFFKHSLRDFLPQQTLRKKKHGFGLPFGPWLVREPALARFAHSALANLSERRLIRRELVHDLFSTRLSDHAGFYGEMVWVLMMLEHWLAHHAPDLKLD